jgi:tRNA-splicing ligase RtcB
VRENEMKIGNIELNKIRDNVWEIPKSGGMRVPGRIFISKEMMEKSIQNDDAFKQVMNVAHLPGIQKYSLAMPDIHWGYGFPIGGVAATDLDDGVNMNQ